MIRALALVIALALVALLLVLTSRVEEPEQLVTHSTSTTLGSNGPELAFNENFGRLVDASRKPPARARTAPTRRATSGSGHPCGPAFDLPPCWVMMRESRGDIHAYNPTGCGGRGCYGKWQCDPRTCSGQGSEEQQDAEARAIWDHGRGCAAWAAC